MKRKIGIAIGLLLLAAMLAVGLFQRQIGQAMFERAVGARLAGGGDRDFGDGLTVGLCGTGSPLPGSDRAGPCTAVIAGGKVFLVDIGEFGGRRLNAMGINPGRVEAVFLTHFHSDHIDGMGPLALLHWTGSNAKAPLALIGPEGVEEVAEGFNRAYAHDHDYRVAHHGEAIVPSTGGGVRGLPFPVPTEPTVVFERDGLKVTAFPVDHRPVAPAVGYRFDYRGRSVVISGDAVPSPQLVRAAKGADLLVHEALQAKMVKPLSEALAKNGQTETAKITRDILDYHTTPEQAADIARKAGVRQLVLTHLVPPLPNRFFYPAFLGDAADSFDGPIVIGEDGMTFTLPAGSTEIVQKP